jgi:hypothetical protein
MRNISGKSCRENQRKKREKQNFFSSHRGYNPRIALPLGQWHID